MVRDQHSAEINEIKQRIILHNSVLQYTSAAMTDRFKLVAWKWLVIIIDSYQIMNNKARA